MKYSVSHTTTYRYNGPVFLGHNHAHLAPRSFERQQCESFHLSILPAPSVQESWTDYFGNQVTYFTLDQEHRQLSVTARSLIHVREAKVPAPEETPAWEVVRDQVSSASDGQSILAAQFVFESPFVKRSQEAAAYAADSFKPGRPLLEASLDLTERIFHDFRYDSGATSVNTPTAEVFRKKRGVCQDFAHLQIACLRSLRLPARYVSGYLLTDPPAGQPRLIGADASHAWVSVYCPGSGWIDLDPTNNQIPQFRHVTLAWGRDYGDVCPIKGIFLGGGEHSMRVAVDVVPL